MKTPNFSPFGKFIWHDLAAADMAAALNFYTTVFGWTMITEHANGGQFIRLQSGGEDVGSMYKMNLRERKHGVPSHWTPYICVENIVAATQKVELAGGNIVVQPFEVGRVARIALITDSTGAILGLWEPFQND